MYLSLSNPTLSISLTKKIQAPLPFVFDWCTDFREDDSQLVGSTSKKTILEKTSEKVVYVTEMANQGRVLKTNSVVTLTPPDKWHLDAVGDDKDYTGNYQLFAEGNDTRLEMSFDYSFKTEPVPTNEEKTAGNNSFWDKIIVALERDYEKSYKIHSDWTIPNYWVSVPEILD